MALVIEAVIQIGKRALKNSTMILLAAMAFVAIFFLAIPFPIIILSAGGVGLMGGWLWPLKFQPVGSLTNKTEEDEVGEQASLVSRPSLGHSLRVAGIWMTLWFVPLIVLIAVLGISHVLVQEGIFFSKAAVVTFGGAYAVLAYIAQKAVETFGWLRPGEMLDGLGMAETTPGPLIQVVQFVGFMASYRNPGALNPVMAGLLGSIITTWVTFVPCFLWIFLGAPYIEYLRGNKHLTNSLSAITAAVVGVVLNLAVWFSLHTLFGDVQELKRFGIRWYIPEISTLNPGSALITIGAFIAIFRFKTGMIRTLAGSIFAGVLWYAFFHK